MHVSIQRDCDRGMAQDFGQRFDLKADLNGTCRKCVPKCMKMYSLQAACLGVLFQAILQYPWLHECIRSSQNIRGWTLRLHVPAKTSHVFRHRDRSHGGIAFGWTDYDSCSSILWYAGVTQPLQRLYNFDCFISCRNTFPTQCAEFANSDACTQRQGVSFKNRDRFIQLGIAISTLRKLRGMSQDQLAEKANMSRSHLSAIEAPNMIRSFSLETLFNLADALMITPSDLLNTSLFSEQINDLTDSEK